MLLPVFPGEKWLMKEISLIPSLSFMPSTRKKVNYCHWIEKETILCFCFQQNEFQWNYQESAFQKPKFPVHLSFAQYAKSEVSPSKEAAKNSLEMYGWNRFHIPQHAFMKLFQEHGIAPFFLFKVFCVGLWMPDKYWYYSLFTLVMLVIFECTVAQQKILSLAEFKTMSIQPFKMQVKGASK